MTTASAVCDLIVEEPANPRVETILLVDHELSELSRFQTVLTTAGFRVLTARHAGEALLICIRQDQPIDLIIANLVMPDLSGPEMIRTLASRLHDCVRVLYLTREVSDRPKAEEVVDRMLLETVRQMVRGSHGVAKHLAVGPATSRESEVESSSAGR